MTVKEAYRIAQKHNHKPGETLSRIAAFEEGYGFSFIHGDDPNEQYGGGWMVMVDKTTGKSHDSYPLTEERLKLHFIRQIPRSEVLE